MALVYPPFELASSSSTEEFHSYILDVRKAANTKIKKELLKNWLLEKMEEKGFSKSRAKVVRELFTSSTKSEGYKNSPSYGTSPSTIEDYHSIDPAHPLTRGNLENIKQKVSELLLDQQDPAFIDIILGAASSHDLKEGKPVWLLSIGPAGGGKTEHIDMLNLHPRVETIAELTPKTFISGMDPEETKDGKNPSFLLKYPNHIYSFKDLTTTLSMHPNDRAEVFGQLTQIYDGEYKKPFGTGERVVWEGYITILAGVTPMIYQHYGTLGKIGPRFLFIRPIQPPRQDQIKWGLRIQNENTKRKDIQELVRDYFIHLPVYYPTFPDEMVEWYSALGDLIAMGRSNVQHKGDEIEIAYEAEMPARVGKQLKKLSQAIARLYLRPTVTIYEQRLMCRVGWDSIPPVRAHILQQLFQRPEQTASELTKGTRHSQHATRDALEDMSYLGMVQANGMDYGEKWSLTPYTLTLLTTIHSLPLE